MKIFLGADHNGFELKQVLMENLQRAGHEVVDEGDIQLDPDDDFPQYAAKVAQALLAEGDPNARGILLCGSGQGVCMAANRFKGIRASVIWNVAEAHSVRNDDDSNILCLPAHALDTVQAEAIVNAWLATPFAGAPRFKRRIKQMDELT